MSSERMLNLWQLTAADLAAAIASKKVSCMEIVEAHLRRIRASRRGLSASACIRCSSQARYRRFVSRLLFLIHPLHPG
jgi:Asp-tRNA(Asn)/Glu-tRNA(Gln) amidotransferase A subunit family amidase